MARSWLPPKVQSRSVHDLFAFFRIACRLPATSIGQSMSKRSIHHSCFMGFLSAPNDSFKELHNIPYIIDYHCNPFLWKEDQEVFPSLHPATARRNPSRASAPWRATSSAQRPSGRCSSWRRRPRRRHRPSPTGHSDRRFRTGLDRRMNPGTPEIGKSPCTWGRQGCILCFSLTI